MKDVTGLLAAGEALNFNNVGLVHWLVSDLAGSIAFRHGLREVEDALRDLPVPAGKRTPAGTLALLTRARAAVEAAHDQILAELRGLSPSGLTLYCVPASVREAIAAARRCGLWPGATKEAASLARLAISTEGQRDALDEVRGQPVYEGEGWLDTMLWSAEMDLRHHAREVTRWPVIAGEAEVILGGQKAFWPVEALELDER